MESSVNASSLRIELPKVELSDAEMRGVQESFSR